MTGSSMRPVLALLLALPLLSALALPSGAVDAETPPATGALPPAIIAVRANETPITDRVLSNGMITAVEEVLVAPQVEGLAIESLEADIGDRVEAGSVLATLSKDQLILQRSQLEANRAKALAAIAQLEARLAEVQSNSAEAVKASNRARQLADQGTYSTVQAEQAEAQATASLAQVRSVEESIKVAQGRYRGDRRTDEGCRSAAGANRGQGTGVRHRFGARRADRINCQRRRRATVHHHPGWRTGTTRRHRRSRHAPDCRRPERGGASHRRKNPGQGARCG
jgi:multidrug efflux pump subunit AcrA (membrane-fusion protein)